METHLIQGSKEWLEFRKSKITATDAAIILGLSKYETPYKLWQRKLGLIEDKEQTPAMKRGIELEPIARNLFNMDNQSNFQPIVAVCKSYEFLAASLDGYENGEVLEIKCNGEKNHAMAMQGVIPPDHYCQMQLQMFVTDSLKGYYFSFDGNDGKKIEVDFDPQYCQNMIPRLRDFYKQLICFEAPPLQKGDYKEMDSMEWKNLAEDYVLLEKEIKAREEKKDIIRKQLIAMADDTNCFGGGIKVQKTITKGRVTYENVPELKGVNLDPYRKESTVSWRILLDSKISSGNKD